MYPNYAKKITLFNYFLGKDNDGGKYFIGKTEGKGSFSRLFYFPF